MNGEMLYLAGAILAFAAFAAMMAWVSAQSAKLH